jgi:mono/diheme cytochrome c family protein
MMKIAPQFATLISMVLVCVPARAADPANGKRLSERWCASCHVVSPDQRQASADAPAFSSIARQADFDTGRLTLFLLDPHPKMPNMSLTRTEAADIAGYIKTLARPN